MRKKLIEFEQRPFAPEDLQLLDLRPEDLERQMFLDIAVHYPKLGPACSLWYEGKLYACGGMVIYVPGSAELWCFADRGIGLYPLEMYITVKAWIDAQQEAQGLARLQARCDSSWLAANKFMRRLGFELEATMRKHGPNGKDYCLWARVR